MYIKKNSGPIIKPFGTPALTLIHIKTWSFKTTFYFLFLKKSHNKFKNLPDMPFCFNLKIIPSCHALLNAFDISRKTLLTSNPSSDNLYISCVIDKNWLTQKSPGLKPYSFCKIRPFLIRNRNISLNIKRSRILPQIGSNETGR